MSWPFTLWIILKKKHVKIYLYILSFLNIGMVGSVKKKCLKKIKKTGTVCLLHSQYHAHVHISVTKWCLVGYGTGALWHVRNMSIDLVLLKVEYFVSAQKEFIADWINEVDEGALWICFYWWEGGWINKWRTAESRSAALRIHVVVVVGYQVPSLWFTATHLRIEYR